MKWSVVLARAVFSFSLAAAVGASHAQDYAAMRKALGEHPSAAGARRAYERWGKGAARQDPDFAGELAEAASGRMGPTGLRRVAQGLKLRALAQSGPGKAIAGDPRDQADAIKRSPLYQEQRERQASNWLRRAMDNLAEALQRLWDWLSGRRSRSSSGGTLGIGPWLTYAMWALLAMAALVLLVLAIRAFGPIGRRTRRLKAILAEDEPERSADEWLDRALELERQGLFREAVRCLYLACLTRLDEAEVARFVRTQTNWEHLRRIEASPRVPRSVDLRQATRRFDAIWYGAETRGAADVAEFRRTYEDLWSELRARRAA